MITNSPPSSPLSSSTSALEDYRHRHNKVTNSPPSSPLSSATPVLALPVQTLGVDADGALGHGSVVGVNLLHVHGDDVLALVIVDQVQVLQR